MDYEKCDAILDYLRNNFDPDGASAWRLIVNVVFFITANCRTADEAYVMAHELFDDTIGISNEELYNLFLKSARR
ncbi:MAG: hypothetical protein J6S14_19900 [Clostridia bacterium]|nr:hypothetical protein [Clostridia bacterium]